MVKKAKRPRKPAPTERLKKALTTVAVNGGNWYRALKEAGYSEQYSKNPQKIKNTHTFEQIRDQFLPDYKLLATHSKLLNAHRLDHMVFPLGPDSLPEQEDDEMEEGTIIANGESVDLTDKDIIDMLAEVGCTVRKIVNGQQARHVYFWSPDNKAQQAAVDLAYKLKNKIQSSTPPPGTVIPIQVNVDIDRQKYA